MKTLKKVIESLILPKYPWITSFKIKPSNFASFATYDITYYTDPITEVEEDYDKVHELTKTLYKMTGGEGNKIYVDFKPIYRFKPQGWK